MYGINWKIRRYCVRFRGFNQPPNKCASALDKYSIILKFVQTTGTYTHSCEQNYRANRIKAEYNERVGKIISSQRPLVVREKEGRRKKCLHKKILYTYCDNVVRVAYKSCQITVLGKIMESLHLLRLRRDSFDVGRKNYVLSRLFLAFFFFSLAMKNNIEEPMRVRSWVEERKEYM